MADDLRNRVLAAVRKGLAGPLDTPKTEKPRLRGYSVDSSTENAVTNHAARNRTFPSEISAVTALPPVSTNRDSQPEAVCAVCGAASDLWHFGDALVHQECVAFLPKPDPAEPTAAYRGVTAEPDGTRAEVTIVEIPPTGLRYRRTFGALQLRPPALVEVERWRQCVEDGRRFLAAWGAQAEALGWDSRDLFGLHQAPERPHPSYNRLSRYDATGLVWLLQGRPVVALTAETAAIENPATGGITTYRKHNKPALGPVGDSFEDFA
jgi:hypothetical protein